MLMSVVRRGPKQQKARHKGSRVLCPRRVGAVAISLGTSLPACSCDQPGDGPGALCPSIWSCSRWGLPGRHVAMPPVRSYRTISPLPERTRAVCFCCTIRGVAPPGRYPASLPGGARTFLSASRRPFDAITAFTVPNPNCTSQRRRFFQVWLPLGLPRLADHSVYFGSARFILGKPKIS